MMGFLDLCHSMSLLLAGGHTPAPLTVILMQGMIPMTVLISRIYFRIRFVILCSPFPDSILKYIRRIDIRMHNTLVRD